MTQLHRRQLLGSMAGCALLPLTSFAADNWPDRPIKWIVPYLAGTAPDNTARVLAEGVATLLGQPVIIENRAGAGGNIGARLAAKAPPDGYTWVYSSSPMAANMRMYKVPGYDAMKDFRHIMRTTSSDVALIVNASSGIDSLDELLAHARAAPGKLDYSSGGVGTPSHLGVELMLSSTKARATHVPYKGASELVNAVLGKQVTFGMPILSVAYPQIVAGNLKALAIAGSTRNSLLPKVPTFAELGMPNVQLTSWGGISVPAGTSDAIVARIQGAFERALKQPSVMTGLVNAGGQITPLPPEAYTLGFLEEMTLTETMMKRAGLSAQ
ncbi:Bug family tripartite tricarboxylate transporter substrate binding protein [Variovorax ginsengisoli]|uniref:Tripartite-type tricarboxylate transporter receptor subunit TctC n=1 Tax=Variovorax ginsengisoli TaxID=363844 RepID=A0ABT9SF62_9BURK|nr:tripartite tricarboxylate transporter substrate binding protein [Variovorax ginsengisoli]MDP9903010.1 tripartite-type tricarboxylate transporter receptor subunit TctC [Variovorax ginsengisoli]